MQIFIDALQYQICMHIYILQINAVINVVFFCANIILCRFCKNINRIFEDIKDIHRSAVTYNTKEYLLFLLEDILQIFIKKYISYSIHYLRISLYKYRQ